MSKIRIKHGDNEIELDGSESFVKDQLVSFYKKIEDFPVCNPVADTKQKILKSPQTKINPKKTQTPAEFFKSKNKNDGVSQILIFGKYLEEYRKVSDFTRKDINSLAQEAKLPKDIHCQYFTNAVKQGLLRSHGSGRYSLTISAETVIANM